MAVAPMVPCPYCRDAREKPTLGEWKGYRVLDCAGCGVAFADPFKNPGAEYYAHYEDLYSASAQTATDAMSFEYDAGLAVLASAAPGVRRLLDVGCGGGGFLFRARELGFEVAGVDFNRERLEAVRRAHGMDDLHCMDLPRFARENPGRRFDFVTIFEVLEHLDDPADWLKAAFDLLEPGGRLIVGVPNRDRSFDPFGDESMLEVDNPPHHLTRWRAAPLGAFIAQAGFSILELRPLAVPRPLLGLLARNRLRLGLATRALGVDQLQHLPASGPGPRGRLLLALVALKSALIDLLVLLLYPFFRLACALFAWQGVILFCVAEKPKD